MVTPELIAFVRAALLPPPARILEVGAGRGELAATLRQAGYHVIAIDPEGEAPEVVPLALHKLQEPAGSFDAAVAVLSLHHVEPLPESCRKLAHVIRSGGALVVDEFDVERFDERAARWWMEQRNAAGRDAPDDASTMVAELRGDTHPLSLLEEGLRPYFALGRPIRGAYLHRWDLPSSLRAVEEQLIAAEQLPATGARFVATRR